MSMHPYGEKQLVHPYGEKQLEEAHAALLKLANLPPSAPAYGQPYLVKWKVDEFLGSLPKIRADGSNYTLWKKNFDAGGTHYPCFNPLSRDLDAEKDEPIALAIAAALELMLSPKIANFLEDSTFADLISHLSCKQQLERIDNRYAITELEQIKKDLMNGFAADGTTRSVNSTKRLFAERADLSRSLADNPKIAPPALLFSPLLYYRDGDGDFPVSTKKFVHEVAEKIMNTPPEGEDSVGEQLGRWAELSRDFSRKGENFALDQKVFYTPDVDAEAPAAHADVVRSGICDPEFARYAKFFYSKETKPPIKSIGISKEKLFKYFLKVKLCPLCLEQECDFASHQCAR